MTALFLPVANAQNEGQYTHFMYNRLSYNPAYAGSAGAIGFTLLYKNQWMGLTLQPSTAGGDPGKTPVNYLFSFDMPVNFLHGGIGLTLNSESIGYHNNIGINIDYAFRIFWGDGCLSAGIEANLYSVSFEASKLVGSSGMTGDPANPLSGTSDPLVNGQDVSDFMIDVSTGLYYNVPGLYYLGLSVKNLLGAKSDELNWQNSRTLYLMGGYEYTLPFNPSLKLKPSAMMKTADFSVFQAEAALLLDYENTLWGGLGYRFRDAFTFLAGVNYKWFRIGVAYDLTTSKLGTFKSGRTFGSLEIFASGSFRIEVPKRNPTVSRNTRFQL